MRTEKHWEQCNNLASYHAAQNLALQLKEVAKTKGFDPRGIKVLSKKDTRNTKMPADSLVRWNEGPLCWAYATELRKIPNVCVDIVDDHTIAFYDI